MGVLITGSSGFLGYYLSHYLKDDFEIIKGVRNSKNTPHEISYGDLEDWPSSMSWISELKNLDVVVHCAGRAHIMNDESTDPLKEFRKINVEATKALAKASLEVGVKIFIYISSIKVNGEKTDKGVFTSSSIPNPSDPYGVSKHEAEIFLEELSKNSNMKIVVIRPPLIYGRGVKGNLAKLKKLIHAFPVIPLGGIKNKRSMVSLKNLSEMIKMIIIADKLKSFRVYLPSDMNDLSTTELVSLMAKSYNKKIWLIPLPVRLITFLLSLLGKESLSQRLFGNLVVDSSDAQKELGWKPEKNLQEQFSEI